MQKMKNNNVLNELNSANSNYDYDYDHAKCIEEIARKVCDNRRLAVSLDELSL